MPAATQLGPTLILTIMPAAPGKSKWFSPLFDPSSKIDPHCNGRSSLLPSLTIENYVKTIYQTCAAQGERAAATGQLAAALGVSPGTVTSMLKTLSDTGLAQYTPYEGAKLTEAGRHLALRIVRRHRLIELFLVHTLDFTWDEVHDEAENLEHSVSDMLVDRIDRFLGYPPADPHGDPIPTADGRIEKSDATHLSHWPAGTPFRLQRSPRPVPRFPAILE